MYIAQVCVWRLWLWIFARLWLIGYSCVLRAGLQQLTSVKIVSKTDPHHFKPRVQKTDLGCVGVVGPEASGFRHSKVDSACNLHRGHHDD